MNPARPLKTHLSIKTTLNNKVTDMHDVAGRPKLSLSFFVVCSSRYILTSSTFYTVVFYFVFALVTTDRALHCALSTGNVLAFLCSGFCVISTVTFYLNSSCYWRLLLYVRASMNRRISARPELIREVGYTEIMTHRYIYSTMRDQQNHSYSHPYVAMLTAQYIYMCVSDIFALLSHVKVTVQASTFHLHVAKT